MITVIKEGKVIREDSEEYTFVKNKVLEKLEKIECSKCGQVVKAGPTDASPVKYYITDWSGVNLVYKCSCCGNKITIPIVTYSKELDKYVSNKYLWEHFFKEHGIKKNKKAYISDFFGV